MIHIRYIFLILLLINVVQIQGQNKDTPTISKSSTSQLKNLELTPQAYPLKGFETKKLKEFYKAADGKKDGVLLFTKDHPESDINFFGSISLFNATIDEMEAVMKDYNHFHEFMPLMLPKDGSKIISSKNNSEFTVMYNVKVGWKKLNYTLKYTHSRIENSYIIQWHYIKGDLKNTFGYWHFDYFTPPHEGETRALTMLKGTYLVYTDPGIMVPDFIINMLTKSSIPDLTKRIRKRIVSQRTKLQETKIISTQ